MVSNANRAFFADSVSFQFLAVGPIVSKWEVFFHDPPHQFSAPSTSKRTFSIHVICWHHHVMTFYKALNCRHCTQSRLPELGFRGPTLYGIPFCYHHLVHCCVVAQTVAVKFDVVLEYATRKKLKTLLPAIVPRKQPLHVFMFCMRIPRRAFPSESPLPSGVLRILLAAGPIAIYTFPTCTLFPLS